MLQSWSEKTEYAEGAALFLKATVGRPSPSPPIMMVFDLSLLVLAAALLSYHSTHRHTVSFASLASEILVAAETSSRVGQETAPGQGDWPTNKASSSVVQAIPWLHFHDIRMLL